MIEKGGKARPCGYEPAATAFWNLLPPAIPAVAFLIGVVVMLSNRSRDFADGIGQVLL